MRRQRPGVPVRDTDRAVPAAEAGARGVPPAAAHHAHRPRPVPKWNSRSTASPEGTAFLRDLFDCCFNVEWPGDEFLFVDEFKLPARTDAEKGGYPDYALLWDDHLWIIELKTEAGSHRGDQIPMYFRNARHHHPTSAIDLTYLTGPGSESGRASEAWERFSHVGWGDVRPLIESHWPDPQLPGQREVVEGVLLTIDSLGSPTSEWRERMAGLTDVTPSAPDPAEPSEPAILEMADMVAEDGEQSAVDIRVPSLDDLHALRIRMRDILADSPAGHPRRHIGPWVWREASSGGQALTAAGEERGHELRLSHYQKPRY